MDAQEIIGLLNERAEDFCRWLFPTGKKNGSYWEIGSITGAPGDSLRIHIAGDMVGVWADHGAGEDATGATLIHLLMRQRATTNWGKVLVEVKEWLGLEITPGEDRAFREQQRNGGQFETAAKHYAKLNPDGPVFRYLTEERRIGTANLARYRVCEHKDQAAMCFAQVAAGNRQVVFAKYVAVQRGPDGKKREWSDPTGGKPGLWGKYAVESEDGEVVITEGEIDALSVAELGFDAVSMPNGAKNDDWVERDWRWLEQFHSIILCFDQDEAGAAGLEKAYPKLVARLGRHRCRIVRLPEGINDPNDALMQGRQDDLMAALNGAQSIDPESLANASAYRDEVHEIFFPSDGAPDGIAVPWTDRLRLRPSEVTLWTGINSHGKTTLLLHCIAHLTQMHGERAIIASMESPVRKTAAILCRQIAGGSIKGRQLFHRTFDAMERQVWFYDHVGNASWRELLSTFRYAWRRYGVSQFVIDSLMTCEIETDDYNEQSRFVGELAAFADETKGHVHIVAHPRKGASENDPPGKMDVGGHANLTNRVFNGLSVWRNKAKGDQLHDALEARDEPLIRKAKLLHDAELTIWKQRETGDEFLLRLWLHKDSLQFWPGANASDKSYLVQERTYLNTSKAA